MQDAKDQLQIFRRAVELLGGAIPTSQYLKVSERQVRGLLAGERTLHNGFLRDTAAALIEHADTCRQLERRISPAFSGNLTEAQVKGTTNRGRRTDLEAKRQQKPLIDHTAEVRDHALANGRTPLRWEFNEAALRELADSVGLTFDAAADRDALYDIPIARIDDHLPDPKFRLVVAERNPNG